MRARVVQTARALADRKGVTSIEYAIIATAAAAILASCFDLFAGRISSLIGGIVVR